MKCSLGDLNSRILRLRYRYGNFWPLVMGFTSLAVLFFGAVFVFMVIEGWSFLDSVYMVVITLSTVGFQEVHVLSENGRLFTILLILLGVGNFAFLVGSFTQILVEGRLQAIWGRHKVQKTIDKLENHVIICGYGRIGSIVAREVCSHGKLPAVIIDKDPEHAMQIEEKGYLYLIGDATSDEILERAGIGRASALIAALSLEAANVYVALTARQLNQNLYIVARADSEQHITRLKMAGADRVMMPHTLGGMRMAQSVLRPTVTSFLEMAMMGEGMDLQMEEVEISAKSEIVDKDLIESQIRPRFNVIVIAIKKPDGRMIFNPVPQEVLRAGDTLIIVGKGQNCQQLREIL